MITTIEEALAEIGKLVAPLEVEGAVAIYNVVKLLVEHKDGAELAARRTAEELTFQAAIRS